jgi:anhydro-N-acetylmuramic acid kinase
MTAVAPGPHREAWSPRCCARCSPNTGRDVFNLAWVRRRYPQLARVPAATVQCTLAELTARTIAAAVAAHAPGTRRVLVCGGGVNNAFLMRRLGNLLAPVPVATTAAHGLDPQHVEAAAFAWLAMRTINGLPGNVPAVTGARRAAILGGIYRA